jgi:hypothetical protein
VDTVQLASFKKRYVLLSARRVGLNEVEKIVLKSGNPGVSIIIGQMPKGGEEKVGTYVSTVSSFLPSFRLSPETKNEVK